MEWISVKDRLPEIVQSHKEDISQSVAVIMMLKNGEIYKGYLSHWFEDDFIPDNFSWYYSDSGEMESGITHWMPLPESPK